MPSRALEEQVHTLTERVEALEERDRAVTYGATLNPIEHCRARRCTYYTEYLMSGPPYLAHEGFHRVEAVRDAVQRRILTWRSEHRLPDPEANEYDDLVLHEHRLRAETRDDDESRRRRDVDAR